MKKYRALFVMIKVLLSKFVLNVKVIQMKLEILDVLPVKGIIILWFNVRNVNRDST